MSESTVSRQTGLVGVINEGKQFISMENVLPATTRKQNLHFRFLKEGLDMVKGYHQEGTPSRSKGSDRKETAY